MLSLVITTSSVPPFHDLLIKAERRSKVDEFDRRGFIKTIDVYIQIAGDD